jgi:hypothetical protein
MDRVGRVSVASLAIFRVESVWELRPAYQNPAGDNAHTVAARPRRAGSMAIQPPIKLPAR